MAKKGINYLETFMFPDIPYQLFPVYAKSESGKIVNIKSILYPSPKSRKKFTRRKQLLYRSLQAKIFDSLINIGYFNPLPVIKEFPIIIQNSLRLPGQVGLWYLGDYFFSTMNLIVELDSELHKVDKDEIRDRYLLDNYGIQVFRINNLEKESVQRGKFQELIKLLKSKTPLSKPRVFDFSVDLRLGKY